MGSEERPSDTTVTNGKPETADTTDVYPHLDKARIEDIHPHLLVKRDTSLPVATRKGHVFMKEDEKRRFLEHFIQHGNKAQAARYAGVSRTTVYLHIEKDEQFSELVEDAYELYCESIVAEMQRRALDGVDEPLSYQGRLTGQYINRKSDRLLERLAEAKVPGFGKKVDVEHKHSGGILLVQSDVNSADEWVAKHGGRKQVEASVTDVVDGVVDGHAPQKEDGGQGAHGENLSGEGQPENGHDPS